MALIGYRQYTLGVHQTAAPEHLIYESVDGVHFLDNQARPSLACHIQIKRTSLFVYSINILTPY